MCRRGLDWIDEMTPTRPKGERCSMALFIAGIAVVWGGTVCLVIAAIWG
jgi:hypothetical protein